MIVRAVPTFDARSYAFTPYVDALNFIGGAFTPSVSGETLSVENPRHGREMARVAMSGTADVELAVKAARKAQPAWGDLPLRERAQVFYRLKALLERDKEELSWLISHENGKTFGESVAEIEKTIECAEFGCALPQMAGGAGLEVSRGVTCQEIHEPLGVVAGIAPFNFPLMVGMWMLPQAIVAGNAFIMKPSEQVPLSTQRLCELFKEAGLPDGIFNVVNGGREAVEALCDHPDIKALAFVGSTRVAKLVYGRAAASGKAALCLGGAKNHLIVVPDADPDLTTENVVASFTGCAGQRCMAASVMLAVGDVQHLIDRIAKKASQMRIGQDLGPVTTEASRDRMLGFVNDAEQRGATVLVDGRRSTADEGGHWFGPTILDHVTPDMPAGNEEIFGPVLSIVRVATVDEAIAIENANPYGNASAVYTTNGEVARYVIRKVEAGMVGVNVGVPVPREPFGFGGWNNSKFGTGNITGWDGFRFWTRPRKITTKWALQKDWTWMS
jgi:malonate-semialdehyde dehydrogenase (acetylating)/methylmalonate-semialdehyde dehydrogenase